MTVLVYGGAASGKSEYAETLILNGQENPRIYLATMEPFGEEGRARIERHRKLRENKGFVTLERCTSLSSLHVPRGSAVLLEDLGNLCANELFSPEGAGSGRVLGEILSGIENLAQQAGRLVIVSNDIFSGAGQYEGEMAQYLCLMGTLHQIIAEIASTVVEVVCGIPIFHKGGTPCAN